MAARYLNETESDPSGEFMCALAGINPVTWCTVSYPSVSSISIFRKVVVWM